MKQSTFHSAKNPASQSTQTAHTGLVTPMRRLRVIYVIAVFAFWAGLIGIRLVWLQVFRHHEFVERAAMQQQRTFEVAPRRGVLYDRNLHELAMTVLADSIYAVPSEIGEARPATAAALAKVVHVDSTDSFTSERQILARLNASRNFAWIARKQDPAIIAKIKALNLKGVYIQKEFKRFYPDNQLAAQVLGYVGLDDTGLGGLELNFDDDLHGTPGRMLTAIDARRHVLDSEESDPLPGENLVLTLDANIQFMAEQALDRNMERTHSQTGTIVVQDPHTGQILALAIRPTFNPNDFRHATTNLLRDHAVSDVYEPGSTFKPVTYSAALEEKAITPDTILDCGGGQINIAGHTVHDAPGDHFGLIPAWKALAVSSNVCAIRVGERLGPDRLYKYIRAFGFGDRTGIELPAETRGLLEPLKHWGPSSMGAIPMGQEVAVTPIQIVTMVSTIANGGVYLPPHILLKSTELMKGNPKLLPAAFHPESSLPDPLPDGAHRVISEMTAAQVRKMMEDVVLIGTAHEAVHLNGYSAAGKTGTAQKIDPATHTYSKTKFVASFVGFAPVNNPAIAIAIVMDSPDHSMHFGAQASAPVFQDLAQQILEYLGVPHDKEMKPEAELAKNQAQAVDDDQSEQSDADLNSLFAEVNDLPADDPLRAPQQSPGQAAPVAKNERPPSAEKSSEEVDHPTSSTTAMAETITPKPAEEPVPTPPMPTAPLPAPVVNGSVVVNAAKKVAVPSLVGQSVRDAIEQAGSAGLGVQVLGTGIAREQAPAAGTMVPAGTEIVVRFTR
ncbi:penicillin-binding transpeptidase domain-containing protein [Alloacidobacterium sp.]|uniref:penicillin-binding transpeptidase domain-containing protein n=1 Tax=Alloacidobacterium sp. TaxID=2951999 RepID=UPI002D6C4E8D|nr:penicillin-binding transpeptidase domain-containing protein [Alloacidobacterium sp.]HYK36817.1 penicillin-binding transpeptidase domain-containing protein [Alloacidobacterium sp.]